MYTKKKIHAKKNVVKESKEYFRFQQAGKMQNDFDGNTKLLWKWMKRELSMSEKVQKNFT